MTARARAWDLAKRQPCLLAYIAASVAIVLLLAIDPLFNKPDGLITTSWFTGRPSTHGSEKCSFDYEGSWAVGVMQGDSPLFTNISNSSVLDCQMVGSMKASYIAEPCLVLPLPGITNQSFWYAFYQVKNLESGKGEIGVAMSSDRGNSWQHLGVALSEPFSISSPFVTYDEDSQQYVMIPDTHKSKDLSVTMYTTSTKEFPFGWKKLKVSLKGLRYTDTTAIKLNGTWHIFTTSKDHGPWHDQAHYELRLFTTNSLTQTNWTEHPMSPITTDLRYARSGGRPFIYQGKVYRWAQDDSGVFGQSLHLFRLDHVTSDSYMETYVKSIEPSGDSGSWYSARTHHVDIQQLPDGQGWFGLVDGDQVKDGTHHFWKQSARFVKFKASLLRLMWVQLAFMVVVSLAWHLSDPLMLWCCGMKRSELKLGQQLGMVIKACAPEAQLVSLMAVSVISTCLLFSAFPGSFYCPRWNVLVNVIDTPPVTHVDPAAPLPVSDLVVVTAATASFFDRMQNMVGSLHTWAPDQRVIVYDLGFSSSQLAQMMCWRNVELRRFPYDKYPKHVSDCRNYAFKAVAIHEALQLHSSAIWIDSGLELRAPMDRLLRLMSQNGHVSAMQEDLIGDPMYTFTKNQVEFFGLGHKWDEIKKWQFCAGGLQGFVRDSDAHRLVLQPVLNCSLTPDCIAPPGSSRLNHNFDQTAFTVMIWQNNFSCLPRETHCMWSVKKASRDPLQLSTPIEMISRGHRQPKPYTPYVRMAPSCQPDKSRLPWPATGLEHAESLSRYNLTFRVSRIYLQPVADLMTMTGSCVGTHVLVQLLYCALLAATYCGVVARRLGRAWGHSRVRMALHLTLGTAVLLMWQAAYLYITSVIVQ